MSEPPAGYRGRPASLEDVDAFAEITRAADLADAGVEDPVRQQIAEWFAMPVFDPGRDAVLVTDGDGAPAAFVSVFSLNPDRSAEGRVVVHPAHRGRGLGTWGIGEVERLVRSRDVVAPRVALETPGGATAARALVEAHGYAYVRTFWHMERVLDGPIEPAAVPDGIEISTFDAERDMRPVHVALEAAFADHWNVEPFPYELHEYEMRQRDPELVLVARAGDEVVGASIDEIVEDVGWVGVLGVVREHRGRGLAKALLRLGFARLAERGATRVLLNVDAENTTGATALYRSVGMHVHRSFEIFEKALEPAG